MTQYTLNEIMQALSSAPQQNQYSLDEIVQAVSSAQQTKYLRPKQSAALLGIGLSTLWKWSTQPGFPRPYKRPGYTAWDKSQLIAWQDAQNVEGAE